MTSEAGSLLGPGGIAFLAAYLISLVVVGWLGHRARREDSLADFYLSGRAMGPFVLLLTLYATQYSGNTLIGFAGDAYRNGYRFLVSVTFMAAVIGAYLIYAPRLQRLSRRHGYITTGDFLDHRFGSPALTLLATLLGIVALANYILTNLKAIGLVIQTAFGERVWFEVGGWEVTSFTGGIIVSSLVMVVYETLGGMRSVAWTDVIQGLLLLLGCVCIFGAIEFEYGGLSAAAEQLITARPDLWEPPSPEQKRLWMSTLVLVFFGISLYPHAIQRIYAARSERTLRWSLQVMVFMPLVTTFFMIAVGVVGAARFPGLDRLESDEVTLRLLSDLATRLPGMYALIVLFVCAAVAAIMSTVDSALLALASVFTKDLYHRAVGQVAESHLTLVGKLFSWAVMAFMAWLAMTLDQTIWQLVEIKLELLCQIAPALFLGLHCRSLRAGPVLCGMIAGTTATVFMLFGPEEWLAKPGGVHAGVWALAINGTIVGLGQWLGRTRHENGGTNG